MKGFSINRLLMSVVITAIGVAVIFRVPAVRKIVVGE